MTTPDASENLQDEIARLQRENTRLAREKSQAEAAGEQLKRQTDAASKQIGDAATAVANALTSAQTTLAAQPPSADRLPRRPMAAGLALIQLVAAWWLSGRIDVQSPGYFNSPADTAPLVAFSVALAAYLATVRRELVKTLASKTGAERRDRKIEGIMVTGGEEATVALGLGAVARMVFAQGPHPAYDAFLLTLLAVNIVYLAIVHLVEWLL